MLCVPQLMCSKDPVRIYFLYKYIRDNILQINILRKRKLTKNVTLKKISRLSFTLMHGMSTAYDLYLLK